MDTLQKVLDAAVEFLVDQGMVAPGVSDPEFFAATVFAVAKVLKVETVVKKDLSNVSQEEGERRMTQAREVLLHKALERSIKLISEEDAAPSNVVKPS